MHSCTRVRVCVCVKGGREGRGRGDAPHQHSREQQQQQAGLGDLLFPLLLMSDLFLTLNSNRRKNGEEEVSDRHHGSVCLGLPLLRQTGVDKGIRTSIQLVATLGFFPPDCTGNYSTCGVHGAQGCRDAWCAV